MTTLKMHNSEIPLASAEASHAIGLLLRMLNACCDYFNFPRRFARLELIQTRDS